MGALHLHAQVPERVSFLAAVYWRAYHYKQHINTAQAQTLAFFAPSHLDFPAYALFAPANSAQTISPGNMPIALPTQGKAGQSNVQFGGLPAESTNVGIGMAPTLLGLNQYTNTNQSSSSGVTPYQYLQYIASAAGGLANWAVTPPGYTPGGQPLAGGSYFTSS